jgi:hypothetical protein
MELSREGMLMKQKKESQDQELKKNEREVKWDMWNT